MKPIPDGYHAVTPYLSVAGAANAIEFYKQAFGAKEVIHLYVGDVDKVVQQAVAAGGKILRPVGSVEDPFGHVWHVSTHKEDVSPAELKKRAAAKASAAGAS